MGRKNKKKNKQATQPLNQTQILEEPPKPSLNIILSDVLDPELMSQWPKLNNKVPSIFLHHPAVFTSHLKKVVSMGIQILPYRQYSNHDKITCVSLNDHKLLIQYFEKLQLPYHTFGQPSKRKLKVVIKGLPADIDLNNLRKELCSMSVPVIRMHKMHLKDFGKVPPLFVLAVLPYDAEGKNIFRLKSVAGKDVKLEPPEIKPVQCYRCQKWGHSQRYCHGQIKCLKCAGEHLYKKCERDPEKEEPKCANCGENHTANYKECPFCPSSFKYKLAHKIRQLRHKRVRELVL